MTDHPILPPEAANFVRSEPVGAWSKLVDADPTLRAKLAALQSKPSDGRKWMWCLLDCAVEHLTSAPALRRAILADVVPKMVEMARELQGGRDSWYEYSPASIIAALEEEV